MKGHGVPDSVGILNPNKRTKQKVLGQCNQMPLENVDYKAKEVSVTL